MVTQSSRTVERTIYFYLSFVGVSTAGGFAPFDPTPILNGIKASVGTLDWYQDYGDVGGDVGGDVLGLLPDGLLRGYPRARLCLIRRTAIPQLEHNGSIVDIPTRQGQGVVEVTHLVFFPGNVIGSDYNYHGPRISRFPSYLREKMPTSADAKNLRILAMIRGDTTAVLDELIGANALEIAVLPSARQLVRANDRNLGTALDAIAGIGNADLVDLRYRTVVNEREGLLRQWTGLFRELLPNADFTSGTRKLKVHGKRSPRSKIEMFDLLKDVMTSKQEIVKLSKSRALDSQNAYEKIIAAYDTMLPEIQQASAVMKP